MNTNVGCRHTDKFIEFPFPILRTHCSIAMGNGNFGALVWGQLRLAIPDRKAMVMDRRDIDQPVASGQLSVKDIVKYYHILYP